MSNLEPIKPELLNAKARQAKERLAQASVNLDFAAACLGQAREAHKRAKSEHEAAQRSNAWHLGATAMRVDQMLRAEQQPAPLTRQQRNAVEPEGYERADRACAKAHGIGYAPCDDCLRPEVEAVSRSAAQIEPTHTETPGSQQTVSAEHLALLREAYDRPVEGQGYAGAESTKERAEAIESVVAQILGES